MKFHTPAFLRGLQILACLLPVLATAAASNVEQWGIYEIKLKGPANGNPFVDAQCSAEFDNGSKKVGHKLFDHRQPWVTHLSVQDGHARESPASAKIYRDAFRKPVVFDEIKYEGDAKFRWADLDGFDMVHRFWSAMMGGTYVGHGDYFNTLDEDTWASFGGKILGESAPRLAFLRNIVEAGPAGGLDLIDSGWTHA